MNQKPNILVVCGRNKRRSRTAEFIFKNDSRFNIRSVGLSPKSERQIKENDISWSDEVFVMDDDQKARVSGSFRHLDLPQIHVLHIDDEYDYLDDDLIQMLEEKINSTLKVELGI